MKKIFFVVLSVLLLIGCSPKPEVPPDLPITQSEFWELMTGTWSSTTGNVFIDFRNDARGNQTFASGIWETEAGRSGGVVSDFLAVDGDTVSFTISYPAVPANMMHDEWPAISGDVTINYAFEPLSMMVKIQQDLAFNQLPYDFVEFTKGDQLVISPPEDPALSLMEFWTMMAGSWHENTEANHSFVDFRFNSANEPIFSTGGYPMNFIHRNGTITNYEKLDASKVKFDVSYIEQAGATASEIIPAIKESITVDFSNLPSSIKVLLPDQICHCGSSYSEINYNLGTPVNLGVLGTPPTMTLSELWKQIKGTWYYLDDFWFIDFRYNSQNQPIVAAGSVQVPGRQNCIASDLSEQATQVYKFKVDCDAMTINAYISFPAVTSEVVVDLNQYPASIKTKIPGDAFSIGANYVNEICYKGVTMNLDELMNRKPIENDTDLWQLLNGYWVDKYSTLLIPRGQTVYDVYITFTKDKMANPTVNTGLVGSESYRTQGKISNFVVDPQNSMKFSFSVTFAEVPKNAEHDLLPATTQTIKVGIDHYPNYITLEIPKELTFGKIPTNGVKFQERMLIIKVPIIKINP